MIQIGCTSQKMNEDFLLAPGGFAWWYLDLITPEGDGLVLIWSYGLPFLPGYADGARRGHAQRPVERPSVNVVVYEKGRASFYLLQEYPSTAPSPSNPLSHKGRGGTVCCRTDAPVTGYASTLLPSWERGGEPKRAGVRAQPEQPQVQQIGDCRFESRVVDGRLLLEVNLDCPVPGSTDRLTGTVRVEGVARRPSERFSFSADAPHLWTPLTGPAVGEAMLDLGRTPVARLRGRAYHDRNGGGQPLHELGIHRWMWGRFPLEECELIYYLLWPTAAGEPPRLLGLTIDREGVTQVTEELTVELGRERRGFAGIRWPETVILLRDGTPWAMIRHCSVVDNGPFYLRFESRVTTGRGEHVLGWGELCEPDRVDLALYRPLVRMRVHHAAARNSPWLPLFSGPHAGRVGRWMRSLLPGGAE
ncbi:MAG TPA: hypothetical protein VGR27_03550 [Longimicrobiaceae bacterium]|nr:hypothetical protein [Longimicrobiaceae bacterium]